MVGVSMFNPRYKRRGERDRRVKVEAIDGGTAARAVYPLHRCAVKLISKRLLSITPRTKEIILRAGSVDGGRLLSIDEKHVVSFAEPVILVLKNGHGDPNKVALS